MKSGRRITWFFLMAAVVVGMDQITKHLAMQKLSVVGEFSLIPGLFEAKFYQNNGIAFGIPLSGVWLIIFLSAVFVTLLVLFWKYLRQDNFVSVFALALVLGGALGNIIDRLRFGYVVDFISWWNMSVFNLADVAIVFGVLLLVYRIILLENLESKSSQKISKK